MGCAAGVSRVASAESDQDEAGNDKACRYELCRELPSTKAFL